MPSRVLVLDTSVMCCLIGIPGKETCGPKHDIWNNERIEALLAREASSTLVLPLATIIETGNHIAQSPSQRYETASKLANYISATANGKTPWAAFTEQNELWDPDRLQSLAKEWPQLAASRLSMGDVTIRDVAEFYAKAGFEVEIVTGDSGLKAYEPKTKPKIPRRRL